MKLEDKDLLLKDLCARLPYGVKCEVYNRIGVLDEVTTFYGVGVTYSNGQDTTCRIDECKPYLFPLSSMTEEQTKIYLKLEAMCILSSTDKIGPKIEFFDWLDRNHFDYRGLIEKGLAIDATNLNIY